MSENPRVGSSILSLGTITKSGAYGKYRKRLILLVRKFVQGFGITDGALCHHATLEKMVPAENDFHRKRSLAKHQIVSIVFLLQVVACLKLIQRAFDPLRPLAQHMGVNHGSGNIAMT